MHIFFILNVILGGAFQFHLGRDSEEIVKR